MGKYHKNYFHFNKLTLIIIDKTYFVHKMTVFQTF